MKKKLVDALNDCVITGRIRYCVVSAYNVTGEIYVEGSRAPRLSAESLERNPHAYIQRTGYGVKRAIEECEGGARGRVHVYDPGQQTWWPVAVRSDESAT